ncbi:MAG: lysoplasmalogenase [Flavobacteriales bacterium]|nr:lysoplasmalogenase [Flavobacteriales bacterium]
MRLLKHPLINGLAFAAVTGGTILGELTGNHGLVYLCKPLMLVILSSWFFFSSRRYGDRFTLMIQAGLLFSLIGDIALMLDHWDQFYFMIGLGAFLIAQLCYAMGFAQNIADAGPSPGLLYGILIAALIATFGALFGSDLIARIDDIIVVPVGIYAAAITIMGITAALRFGRTYLPSFIMVFAGALLFMASDSILATHRFARPVSHANWSVLLTYAAAQWLIVSGCLRHVLDPEELRRKAELRT